ncbi:ninjurin-1 isoform X2 [Anthonomus grandis grandis]|uniref:ninjurin-1 isoform X2 n=1 Tax=Anthonomus grandis grandis TaxID=2921223 RepID=UPI002166A7FD|nr:ninjurin-1 isoform X2 [Anthonomus grandis grandis]
MTSNVRKNDAEASNNSHNVDGNVVGIVAATTITLFKKSLDVNKYATKKTIAQGLLDVALLTANASQLKYILQVGEKHEFYGLMLSLITISIILQVTAGLLSILVSILRSYNDDKIDMIVAIVNQIALAFVTGALFCDVIKMNFGLDAAIAVIKT